MCLFLNVVFCLGVYMVLWFVSDFVGFAVWVLDLVGCFACLLVSVFFVVCGWFGCGGCVFIVA